MGYYDVNGGAADWRLLISDEEVGGWTGDIEDHISKAVSGGMDGHTAARMVFKNVTIGSGSTVTVEGSPNGSEGAPVDYVVFLPEGVLD